MEVLVTFLEGDPDQPLIVGCLNNAVQQAPYPLPAHKTRSVFKSQSSPGGGGSNEIRIEDLKGQEQIYVHAQRDFEQHIEHDQHVQVGHERHERVEANSYAEFRAEEHHTVHQDRRCEVKGDDHLTVGRSQQVKAGVGHLVEAGQEIHLYAGKKIVIEAGTELTIKVGSHFIKLDGNGISRVGPDADGIAGTGAGVAVLTALNPAAVGQAGTTHRMPGSSPQEAHDEQMQLLSRSGMPLKGIKVTVAVPGESAPLVVTSDVDGLLPRIKTQTAQDLKAFLNWDKFHVPEGADSYERSRKQ